MTKNDKILCSVEPWDSILRTNRPNGTSRTWYYEETGNPQFLFTITEDMIRHCLENNQFVDCNIFACGDEFEKVEIHEIGDRKHLYIIRVASHTFFRKNLNVGFSPISPKVLVDVKEGKCRIIIEMTTEGQYFETPGTEFAVIERWRIKEGLPPYSVVVMSGNLLVRDIIEKNDYKLRAYGVSTFEGFFVMPQEYIDNPEKIVEFKPNDKKNLFLSYNRNVRFHRVYLVAKLNESQLLHRGKISYQLGHTTFEKLSPKLYNKTKFDILKKGGSRFVDSDLKNNLAQSINMSHYETTFLSLVSETTASVNSIFFSEKIFKPIGLGHPFIILGNPNSLAKLKEMGYKTFDKWIDESYDSISDPYLRTQAIVNEVNKFREYSNDKLKGIREEMKEILIHNKKHYIKLAEIKAGNHLHLPIAQEVKEEWKDLLQ